MNTSKIITEAKRRKHLSMQMRKNRDKSVREKVELFYLAARYQNVREACARLRSPVAALRGQARFI